MFLPVRISRGLWRFEDKGVVQRYKWARSGSVLACLALIRTAFTVCTCLSMNPLDLEYMGEEVEWSNDQSLTKLTKASEVYCVPLSLMSLVGMPCSENICFRALITLLLVASVPSFLTRKNLL